MPQLEWHVHAEIRLLYSRFFFIVKATCNDAAAALFLTLSGLSAALLFPSVRAIVYRLFVDRTLWPSNVHNFFAFYPSVCITAPDLSLLQAKSCFSFFDFDIN
jgi:hypothetical protein